MTVRLFVCSVSRGLYYDSAAITTQHLHVHFIYIGLYSSQAMPDCDRLKQTQA